MRTMFALICIAWTGYVASSSNTFHISLGQTPSIAILEELPSGHLLVGGGGAYQGVSDGPEDPPFLIKLTPLGQVVWRRDYPELQFTRFKGAAAIRDGFAIVAEGLNELASATDGADYAEESTVAVWLLDSEGDIVKKHLDLEGETLLGGAWDHPIIPNDEDQLFLLTSVRNSSSVLRSIDLSGQSNWLYRFEPITTHKPIAIIGNDRIAVAREGKDKRRMRQIHIVILDHTGIPVDTLWVNTGGTSIQALGIYHDVRSQGLLIPTSVGESVTTPSGHYESHFLFAIGMGLDGQLDYAHRLTPQDLRAAFPLGAKGYVFLTNERDGQTINFFDGSGRHTSSHRVRSAFESTQVSSTRILSGRRVALAGHSFEAEGFPRRSVSFVLVRGLETSKPGSEGNCDADQSAIQSREELLLTKWNIYVKRRPETASQRRAAPPSGAAITPSDCARPYPGEYETFLSELISQLKESEMPRYALGRDSGALGIDVTAQDEPVLEMDETPYSPRISVSPCCVDNLRAYLQTDLNPSLATLYQYGVFPFKGQRTMFRNGEHRSEDRLAISDFALAVEAFMAGYKNLSPDVQERFLSNLPGAGSLTAIAISANPEVLEIQFNSRLILGANRIPDVYDYILDREQ